MSFLRRSTGSLTASIRKLTATLARDEAPRIASCASLPHVVKAFKPNDKKSDASKSVVNRISTVRNVQPNPILKEFNTSSFSMSGIKCVLSSNASSVAKLFASFDLSSISISFAGMMGEFAVWAITDTKTGEVIYLVDDNQ